MGFDALAAIKTMVDVKTLPCCDQHAACHVTSIAVVVNKRQAEASAAYRTKARELDHLLIAKQVVAVPPLGTPGPYESVLNSFGKVLAPGVGAFAEMSYDVRQHKPPTTASTSTRSPQRSRACSCSAPAGI